MVKREVYYENSHVLDYNDYEQMVMMIQHTSKKPLSKINNVRKIYFNNEINYLEDELDTSVPDKDVYSIVMVDFDTEHLMVERKSRRSGMIYKDYAPITFCEWGKIFRGDVSWLKDSTYSVLKNLYLEIEVNLHTIGVVVDYERQRFRVDNTDDYVEFDLSVRSVYDPKGDLLAKDLDMKERLDSRHVIMTYEQSTKLPSVFKAMLALVVRTE